MAEKNKKQKSTNELIENLTAINKRGFEDIEKLAVATKRGFDAVDEKFVDLKKEMNERFDQVDKRFDRLEFYVNGHDKRIEVLEDKVRLISVKIGLR
ncbi:MAG: hypothetical protein A2836_03585 [Candidatus Taylorbacteria bacterium RIFCSPHIGHO2_01_FULL_45_63]|uniref:Uncharacterized protein n=1 Tax=Candidatus Taylorbacteria bacterium RIFCSPHIGHO2_02_FULL_45_35 TaxID=1802311 RepID=A0A1G2MQ85_9BACT|nr:MAG: hypothetical protein A2836_03585 [Candidatus Taylorbacteria bacterium RIFCSPHIGHO2_01_FULL_45_63]OHA26047.1 MAG: hypothetical protein A3D56_02925 [Candidatus Taylorbacteria bacterium RIFCSPHIGHO2_02_FULL_45_35]OHA32476.1 MAG: hypothetical protein A3A22_01590 [Candidatus Taylorbacteria bacterium RIFCSPLOWO2_01_FULL_45_34b]